MTTENLNQNSSFTDAKDDSTNREKPPRVLIVEDSFDLGELIQRSLERENMLALHEAYGKSALIRFSEVNPDVVILDINLPDMTGWEVLDAIKESRARYPRPGIIIITAYADPANRLLSRLQGVDQFMVKPFTGAEIAGTVREVLEKRKQASS